VLLIKVLVLTGCPKAKIEICLKEEVVNKQLLVEHILHEGQALCVQYASVAPFFHAHANHDRSFHVAYLFRSFHLVRLFYHCYHVEHSLERLARA
jgi:hypothetical protein